MNPSNTSNNNISKSTFRKAEEEKDEEFDRIIGKMAGLTPGQEPP